MTVIPALLCVALYFYLRRKGRRMLRNGVVLVAAGYFTLAALSDFLSGWIPGFSMVFLALLALVPLSVLVLAAMLIRNGVAVTPPEGRRRVNPLPLALGLLLTALPAFAAPLVFSTNAWAFGLATLILFLCSYFGVAFAIFLFCAIAYGRMPGRQKPAAITVLGSRLLDGEVSPLLRSRLDRAVEIYRSTMPRPVMIPSGLRGRGEHRSEGTAMAAYLLEAGVDPADILVEDKAVNTKENLRLSSELFAASGRSGALVAVTSNYHVLRAALLARSLGLDIEVVGAPTAGYYLPNAFLREFTAVVVENKWLHPVLCVPFAAFTGVLITTMLAQV